MSAPHPCAACADPYAAGWDAGVRYALLAVGNQSSSWPTNVRIAVDTIVRRVRGAAGHGVYLGRVSAR